jgi:ubiquinone/menaquinone biosynthesis C-methylase UbiE
VSGFIEQANDGNSVNVLDLGCGKKPYEFLFKKKLVQASYLGIDISSKSNADALAIGENIPFKDCSFKYVISTQTLEHTIDPSKVLGEIYRILDYDGSLLISTHGVWIEGHETPDMWRWTNTGLVHLLELNGYEVDSVASMPPILSITQLMLLYLPNYTLFRYTITPLFNGLATTLQKRFKYGGPKIHVVHVLKATKRGRNKR